MTRPTTTLPAGIVQQPTECWELLYLDRNGMPWDDGEHSPHFATEADANQFIEANDALHDVVTACPRDEGCWTAIAACGRQIDGGRIEWPTAAVALSEVLDCGWRVIGGTLHCDDCPTCNLADLRAEETTR